MKRTAVTSLFKCKGALSKLVANVPKLIVCNFYHCFCPESQTVLPFHALTDSGNLLRIFHIFFKDGKRLTASCSMMFKNSVEW